MVKKALILLVVINLVLAIFWYLTKEKQGLSLSPDIKVLPKLNTRLDMSPDSDNAAYILEYSEGVCSQDQDCQWAGEGCGGGHGLCTDQPEKYEGIMTTCDVNPDFPENKGYDCVCLENLGQCGWEKKLGND
jgi:hypothetical protein